MGGTDEPPVRGLGNPRPFKAGRRSAQLAVLGSPRPMKLILLSTRIARLTLSRNAGLTFGSISRNMIDILFSQATGSFVLQKFIGFLVCSFLVLGVDELSRR